MSLKVHYLHLHVNYFSDNVIYFSERQGERLHQGVNDIGKCMKDDWA